MKILSVMMSDHYRLDKEAILAGLFVLLLIGFAGKTGLRAVYSFLITILAIWKILTPAYLKGANPIWWGIALTAFLTLLIIFSGVYGFDRKTTGCNLQRALLAVFE
ncbi:MAG: YibE/F family protein [Ruminococcus sp.]